MSSHFHSAGHNIVGGGGLGMRLRLGVGHMLNRYPHSSDLNFRYPTTKISGANGLGMKQGCQLTRVFLSPHFQILTPAETVLNVMK